MSHAPSLSQFQTLFRELARDRGTEAEAQDLADARNDELRREVTTLVEDMRKRSKTPEAMLIELKMLMARATADVSYSERMPLEKDVTTWAIAAYYETDPPAV